MIDIDLRYNFYVQLMLKHPSCSSDKISAALARQPTRAWNVGDAAPGLPKFRTHTVWYLTTRVSGSRFFFREVGSFCDWLVPHSDFLNSFVESGGRCSITVQLDGSENIGDALDPAVAMTLANLGISLGIEVFPNIGFDVEDREVTSE